MIVHRAAWVLPMVVPPIRHGWVAVDAGRIVARGGEGESPPAETPIDGVEPSDGLAILPGLVNAHTHLELSTLSGWMAQQPASSMPAWASSMLAVRLSNVTDPEEPIRRAIAEARATGTAAIGDVTNTMAAWDALADSQLSAVVFKELLGFNSRDAEEQVRAARAELDRLTPLEWIRTGIVPHAPYSVSPALFRAIVADGSENPISVHVAESRDELEFLQAGTGAWRELLEALNAWTDSWQAPGCQPVEYLDSFGLVNNRLLAVHGVHLSDAELAHLARAGATVVTCPRSNRWTGAGTPPVERFYRSDVRVAVGTDSLASVEDLNMFAELAVVRRLARNVPAARILRSATIDGAEALGFGRELGSIEPGKRAELIAVRIPADVEDVEEYLLGGIVERDIQWLDPGWGAPRNTP